MSEDYWITGYKHIGLYLGVNAKTAYRYVRYFGLPARRHGPGKLVRVLKSEVDIWIDRFDYYKKNEGVHKKGKLSIQNDHKTTKLVHS